MKLRRAGALVMAAGLSTVPLGPIVASADQADSDTQPALTNEQLVTAVLDASGLPQHAQLINRFVATNLPKHQVTDATATGQIQYLDKAGKPPVSGNNVTYNVGGPGQTSTATEATFGKPLPIGLHAEYLPNGPRAQGVDPATIPGRSGTMSVRYTVTNTNVAKQQITYANALGSSSTQEQPVFAPFVGSLLATLPAGLALVDAPNAVVGTDKIGQTTLLWNLVLYPPMGNYQQSLNYTVKSDDLQVPPVKMEVVPVATNQAPAIAFSSDLLNQSVSGNAQLASGLSDLDNKTAELAKGAAELATNEAKEASGTSTAANRSADLTGGSKQLAAGLAELSTGLDELSGSSGLPRALATSQELAVAVNKIAAVVGRSSDPPIPVKPFPPDASTLTLYQVVRATGNATKALAVATNLLALSLHALSAGLTTNSGLATADVESVIASLGCPGSAVPECAPLADAKAKLTTIAGQATAVGVDADRTDDGVLALGGIVLSLSKVETGLQDVSVALKSDSMRKPGVYEGLTQLTSGLQASVNAVIKLAAGGSASASGADELFSGSSALSAGLDTLSVGAAALSSGSAQLASGAAELQTDGTAKILNGVVDSSTKPSQAQAYLAAAEARLPDAAPYPPPAEATARVAYVYALEPPPPAPGLNPALVGIGLVLLAAFALLCVRRIRRPVVGGSTQPTAESVATAGPPPPNSWPFS